MKQSNAGSCSSFEFASNEFRPQYLIDSALECLWLSERTLVGVRPANENDEDDEGGEDAEDGESYSSRLDVSTLQILFYRQS